MGDHDPFDLPDETTASQLETVYSSLEDKDFVWLMGSRRGRRIMYRLIDKSGVFRMSYTGEAASTFFNEGQRNLGQALTALIIRASADDYVKMLKEHEEDVRRNADG
jgi:hypothetical protein